MFRPIRYHIGKHRWFYTALACGAVTWFAAQRFPFNVRLAITGDVSYFIYLVLIFSIVVRVPTAQFRDWVDDEDEGLFIVTLITLAAVGFSVVSIFSLLNGGHKHGALFLALSLASAPLGWFVLHTVASLHYAHVYYLARASGGDSEKGGLCFPGTDDPGPWDFLYYSFVIGMTAQVSDVQVVSTPMRRLTMLHGIISFLFNTGLIALAVNAIVALAQSPA